MFRANARIVEGDERDALWETLVAEAPFFDGYRKKTDRVMPLILLSRTDGEE